MKRIVYADTNNSPEAVARRAKLAQGYLQKAYDILDDIGDYTESLIDWSLVDELDQLIKNIDEAFGGEA